MTLSSFLLEPSKENKAIVKDIVANTLEHTPTIIEWFNRHQVNLHSRLNLYTTIDIPCRVASSIEVCALESSSPQIVWCIYIYTPTLDVKLTAEFTALAKEIQYASIYGYGNAKRTDFQCGLCQGRDHPTITCPIKAIHGFFNNNPNPSLANTTQEFMSSASPRTNDDNTLFDIPKNNNQSQGHQTLRTMQAEDEEVVAVDKASQNRRYPPTFLIPPNTLSTNGRSADMTVFAFSQINNHFIVYRS
ncbi:hypothetical protein H1R20_g9250, partial [Candolleomyces eurysporus]